MTEILKLARLKIHLVIRAFLQFWSGSRLRRLVVGGAAVIFWFLMLGLFYQVFLFLEQFGDLSATLTNYMFAFLFLALLVMMGLSNAIICYTSLYRNDEAHFLMSLPLHLENVFAFKTVESILFSLWGMVMLVAPMILGYGIINAAPWYFYLMAAAFSVVFMGLPMELGSLAALFLPVLLPRRRKYVLAITGTAIGIMVVTWGLTLLGQRPRQLLTEAGLQQIMDRIAFCQHWALPSYWVSEGILAAGREELDQSFFLFSLLLSNVLFLGMVTLRLARSFYPRAWARAHSDAAGSRRIDIDNRLDRFLWGILRILPKRLRLLVLKDIRCFRRDPAQWSQVLLFFGLLGLYVLNLPRLGIANLAPYWHSLVSLLNLGAALLTLSTLTSRFIFPQLSLEGRRIWVLGLLPLKRSTILWGKFFFAAGGSFLISGGLIVLSDLMLGLDLWVLAVHLIVVAGACAGLNGLAVGFGAVYPNMRSDNPSEIVSGFGGTVNLLSSIFFILISLALVSVPLHLNAVDRLTGTSFRRIMFISLALQLFFSLCACIIPMVAGIRTFRRMDF
ncbi:MAG: putative ABC transporter permease subunit [Planctomycetota bacterium]